MARKKGGKSKGFVSKGEHSNVSKSTRKLMRRQTTELQTALNKQEAFRQGKNVMLTIPNPDKKEKNKPFIRVNAKEVWGNPNKVYTMKN